MTLDNNSAKKIANDFLTWWNKNISTLSNLYLSDYNDKSYCIDGGEISSYLEGCIVEFKAFYTSPSFLDNRWAVECFINCDLEKSAIGQSKEGIIFAFLNALDQLTSENKEILK